MFSLPEIDRNTWHKHWRNISYTNLMQSWEYGEAKSQTQIWRTHRFLLQDEEGKPVGLLQVLCLSLPFIGGVARINQGPVFFSESWRNSPLTDNIRQVMTAILNTARMNRWWYLSILPNFPANENVDVLLNELGFHRKAVNPYGSAVISLGRDVENIRAGLNGKWRNLLKKSEKMGLELEVPPLNESFPYLMQEYEKMQQEKQFKGIPAKLLKKMTEQKGSMWNPKILFARQGSERVGGVMFVGYGDTCTYLIGWTPYAGRSLMSNYFLLWRTMLLFKDLGYKFLDVGGLDANTREEIAHFKKGLNGEEYSLAGEYSYSFFPIIKK